MSTRIPASWIIVILLVAFFVFFGYHILNAMNKKQENVKFSREGYSPPSLQIVQNEEVYKSVPAEAIVPNLPAPKPMPRVPAQSEEDLRAPEPLQASPPTTQYDPPEATDPMNRNVHMGAEFGSNLRHPEQMIERRPAAGMEGVVESGLGSYVTHNGDNRPQMYSPEMAQNGGEFMSGIHAFDKSVEGIGFSLI
jgi:hypothetical protein